MAGPEMEGGSAIFGGGTPAISPRHGQALSPAPAAMLAVPERGGRGAEEGEEGGWIIMGISPAAPAPPEPAWGSAMLGGG